MTSAEVNLATERATVQFLPTQVTMRDLRHAIVDAGYEVRGDTAQPQAAQQPLPAAQPGNVESLQRKLIVAVVLGAFMVIGSLQRVFPAIPDILGNPYLLLLLATPVQFWAGSPFYRGAWKALQNRTLDINLIVAAITSLAYFYSAAVALFPTFFATRGLPAGAYYYFSVILIIVMLQDALQDARAAAKNGAVATAQPKASSTEGLVTIGEDGVAKTTIPVGGMTCASCVMHIQNALLEVEAWCRPA